MAMLLSRWPSRSQRTWAFSARKQATLSTISAFSNEMGSVCLQAWQKASACWQRWGGAEKSLPRSFQRVNYLSVNSIFKYQLNHPYCSFQYPCQHSSMNSISQAQGTSGIISNFTAVDLYGSGRPIWIFQICCFSIGTYNQRMAIEDGLSAWTMGMHLLTLFLVYAYVKEELVFSFLWALSPSLIVFAAEAYHLVKCHKGIRRAKYIISYTLLLCFLLAMTRVVKNEGGIDGTGIDDHKWLVRHRKCFMMLALAMGTFVFYSAIDNRHKGASSVVKEVLMNIFSALSMPLSVCSGGACHSIYLSTVTSILSSLSVPLTVVVPILNYLGFVMQLVGLLSIYTANKWRSVAFWIYAVGMGLQLWLQGWIGCVLMIVAVLLNAKTNTFTFGKKLFKESIL